MMWEHDNLPMDHHQTNRLLRRRPFPVSKNRIVSIRYSPFVATNGNKNSPDHWNSQVQADHLKRIKPYFRATRLFYFWKQSLDMVKASMMISDQRSTPPFRPPRDLPRHNTVSYTHLTLP